MTENIYLYDINIEDAFHRSVVKNWRLNNVKNGYRWRGYIYQGDDRYTARMEVT